MCIYICERKGVALGVCTWTGIVSVSELLDKREPIIG